MKEIYIASSNQHKIKEFNQMLNPLGYQVLSIKDTSVLDRIEENGSTFEDNAIIKAQYLAKILNVPCIADDSGLEIDCLNKEPGIYSARYMGADTSYIIKNNELIKRTNQHSDRTCRFVCVIALCYPNGENHTFRGEIEGQVNDKIDGKNGFGYDPIFFYPPLNTTLGQLSDEQKNKISHRYNAMTKLMEYLNGKEA